MEDRRVVILEIIDVLRQHSAPSKRLRQSEILALLPHELTRKSLGQYLVILQERGLVVKDNGYYWVSPWDGMSLRLLVDAIVWSKQIPKSYVDPLIDKVKAQAGLDEQKQLAAIVDSKKVYHQEHEEVLSHLKVCDEAIERGRCLEIEYPTYTEKISPIKCVVNNDIYYVVCFAYRDKIETRRLDKMVNARVLDEESFSLEELYKMGYMTQIDDFLSGRIYVSIGLFIMVGVLTGIIMKRKNPEKLLGTLSSIGGFIGVITLLVFHDIHGAAILGGSLTAVILFSLQRWS